MLFIDDFILILFATIPLFTNVEEIYSYLYFYLYFIVKITFQKTISQDKY